MRFLIASVFILATLGSAQASDPLTDFFNRLSGKTQTQEVFSQPRRDKHSRVRVTPHNRGGGVVLATWYKCCKRTASGEPFNPMGMTAAHRGLPFGTRVLVQSVKTGRSVVVRINDRGPFRRGYSYDLAMGAARAIGHTGSGPIHATVLN